MLCRVCCVPSGGDGPKKALLQQMVTTEGLEDRVTLAGAIPHERARDFLVGALPCRAASPEREALRVCLGLEG